MVRGKFAGAGRRAAPCSSPKCPAGQQRERHASRCCDSWCWINPDHRFAASREQPGGTMVAGITISRTPLPKIEAGPRRRRVDPGGASGGRTPRRSAGLRCRATERARCPEGSGGRRAASPSAPRSECAGPASAVLDRRRRDGGGDVEPQVTDPVREREQGPDGRQPPLHALRRVDGLHRQAPGLWMSRRMTSRSGFGTALREMVNVITEGTRMVCSESGTGRAIARSIWSSDDACTYGVSRSGS